jgi:hypothetical protein
VIAKVSALDAPPLHGGLTTVISAVVAPEWSKSDAGIAAVSCVALTKVVPRGLPFQFTTEAETKPLPLTVKRECASFDGSAGGESEVMTGGVPAIISNGTEFEVAVIFDGFVEFTTVTVAVPIDAISRNPMMAAECRSQMSCFAGRRSS